MAEGSGGAINSSALHVFEVLRLVADAEEPLGVSEVGRRLRLPVSTVHRALMTLEESDYIGRFQNTPRFELGPLPTLLNRALVHRFRLHATSRPLLRILAEGTGETASLTVRLGWYGLRLAGVYGSRDIYHRDRLGEVSLLHLSLQGRGILAFLHPDERAAYRRFVERHHSEMAPGDWAALERQFEDSAAKGFVQSEPAQGDKLVAVALPVREASGAAIASLAISGPVHDPKLKALQPLWSETRQTLEAEIAADPAAFASPFAALPVDGIVIRTTQN